MGEKGRGRGVAIIFFEWGWLFSSFFAAHVVVSALVSEKFSSRLAEKNEALFQHSHHMDGIKVIRSGVLFQEPVARQHTSTQIVKPLPHRGFSVIIILVVIIKFCVPKKIGPQRL